MLVIGSLVIIGLNIFPRNLVDTFTVLGPDAEQHAAVSADHWAGVEDEGGAVQAEVEVGGDRHQQRALSAVQVLHGSVTINVKYTRQSWQYSRIYQDIYEYKIMINGLLNMHVSIGTALQFMWNTIVLINARLVAMVLTRKMMMP